MGKGQALLHLRRRPLNGRATALALGLALVFAAGPVAADPCASWPGEPSPLPSVSDDDEMLSRWARLRVRELSEAARYLEQESPVRAQQLWRRVLCIDPSNADARSGIERTPMVAVHTPQIVTRDTGEPSVADAWAGLSQTLHVRLARPAPPPTPSRPTPPQTETAASTRPATTPAPPQTETAASTRPATTPAPPQTETAASTRPATPPAPPPTPRPVDTAAFDQALEELEAQVRGAQFEAALESAERGRRAARELGPGVDAKREARLEVLAATAALALGRSADAQSSFERALDSDPQLTLDPVSTPPKVRRALERVRQEKAQ